MRDQATEQLLDTRRFRDVLGRFATGVVAVTGIDPRTDRPVGLAVNSFTSVSLDPPLVAFCVAHTSTSWPAVRTSDRYCLNILGDDQRQVTAQIAAKGGDKFRGVDWFSSPGGMPVLPGSLAWLECSLFAEHLAGDHVIVVARVHHAEFGAGVRPMVFFGSKYGTFSAPQ
ncbi:flavin reductase family protein [Kibdelosporangium persicum]|uniref:Nitrilotriacetate monooxygenase component B n=1 Tax=Kibdelosporangium persicum TaxID=2698649 RepID=A0ABX2F6S5_9PSEU|nr:flavin reductase family protein [Kibdelosporangium persicum]NRN67060.1 Nitrilotriacetate monooxygenase component B [Kibdelosporangium persicum]